MGFLGGVIHFWKPGHLALHWRCFFLGLSLKGWIMLYSVILDALGYKLEGICIVSGILIMMDIKVLPSLVFLSDDCIRIL